MSTHNICFHGEIRKISVFLIEKSTLDMIGIHKIFFLFLHKNMLWVLIRSASNEYPHRVFMEK